MNKLLIKLVHLLSYSIISNPYIFLNTFFIIKKKIFTKILNFSDFKNYLLVLLSHLQNSIISTYKRIERWQYF